MSLIANAVRKGRCALCSKSVGFPAIEYVNKLMLEYFRKATIINTLCRKERVSRRGITVKAMKLQFGSKTGTMIDRRSMVQIRGKVQCICGIDAYYRLYEVRRAGLRSYAVNISYGRDSVSKKLGFRRDEACRVFEKLVEGYVTPTTLGDIVDDLSRERCCAV